MYTVHHNMKALKHKGLGLLIIIAGLFLFLLATKSLWLPFVARGRGIPNWRTSLLQPGSGTAAGRGDLTVELYQGHRGADAA
ncbi:hypothetical protein SDD30_05985, partial [Moorella naiadis]|uniref:hypothetical protein n=1 Tax=Moorella naiadis (nom. illeg.) TaxID=3093670 RepID=UPI003D9C9116